MASYEIEPRPIALGGGWRLRLLDDDGSEVGAGAYPITDDITETEAYAEACEVGEAWLLSRTVSRGP